MKRSILVLAALTLSLGAAQAQATDKMNDSKTSAGTTGAMNNVNANGVATGPGRRGAAVRLLDQGLARAPSARPPPPTRRRRCRSSKRVPIGMFRGRRRGRRPFSWRHAISSPWLSWSTMARPRRGA